MSKNNKIKKVNSYSSDSDEMIRMLKVLGTVVVIMVAFYLVFAIVSGEISFGSKKEEIEIQNVEILAGTTFSRKEDSYYVLMYDFDDSSAELYSNLYSIYVSNYNTSKMYVVNLGKDVNAKYLVDNSGLVDVSSIDNLKVVNGTLVKIENGIGVSKTIGVDEIKNVLFTQK